VTALELARLHQSLRVGERTTVPSGVDVRLLTGAGFEVASGRSGERDNRAGRPLVVIRLRTLPDFVAAGMRMLVCGLNPSLYAADAGVNFARPGNRFWPAATAARLVTRERDPWHALEVDGVGFTDLVKRATVAAAELRRAEFNAGAERLRWLVGLLRPAVVCFVGLTGWRAAIDRRAVAGVQPGGFGGVPAYLMPNTSGLNARTGPAEFAEHLRAAGTIGGIRARRG
jgi:TDG/mug DNA glycosylase family protein